MSNRPIQEDSPTLHQAITLARKAPLPVGSTLWDVLAPMFPQTDILRDALKKETGIFAPAQVTALKIHSQLQTDALRRLGAVAIDMTHGLDGFLVAVADPWDLQRLAQIEVAVGSACTYCLLPGSVYEALLNRSAPDGVALTPSDASVPDALVDKVVGTDGGTDSVIDFVNKALLGAFEGGASDVHFEYSRDGICVKLRQDGILVSHSVLQGSQRADEVISRIKVLAQLDITERRVPQDGRFRFEFQNRAVDLRVSIMPSVHGEDAVLRLLDKAQLRSDSPVSLQLLGFDPLSAQSLQELASLPHGMMLVTGPTGSGKTTTVYAILSEVNNGQEKIITIEDPVEYELSGVLQIPVNERKNLTFARGLRSILRHDPDRILVGEIRDAETAEIAVQSALTGHQVFTTVHANSMLDVTGRFRHFGLDMFGFMSALNGVIVQRLVRKVCPHCVGTRALTPTESQWLVRHERLETAVPDAVGCEHCRGTGYKGRMVIAEVHSIDDGLRDLVTGGAPVSHLREYIQQSGVQSLGLQSARLVAQGKTTTEEVKRVVGWQ